MPWQRYAWNLGHIVFFCLATLGIHSYRPFRATGHVFVYMAVLLVISLIIEVIQSQLGRSLSTVDVLRNLVGAGLALFIVARPYLHLTLKGFLGFILALDLIGFGMSAWTDFKIQTRAPIIENFESVLTLGYWHGDIDLVDEPIKNGERALQVTMTPSGTKNAEFYPILKDWSGYKTLSVSIFNPENDNLNVTVRVSDEQHDLGLQNHNDRFNQTVSLDQGWNTVIFDLDDIRYAPNNREMDITKMRRLIIFASSIIESKTIFLDDIILQ